MKHTDRNHVPISTDHGISWAFIIPAPDSDGTDQAHSVLSTCRDLFESFGDFLTPLSVEYVLQTYQPGIHPNSVDGSSNPDDVSTVTVSDPAGLSAADLMESFGTTNSGVHWIPRVEFTNNRIKAQVGNKTKLVDKTNCVQYHNGTPSPDDPTWEPLELAVAHRPHSTGEAIDSEYAYHISIHICSSIWVEPTPEGETNRAYLSQFLNRVANSFPVEQVQRDVLRASEFWVDLDLQQYADDFEASEIY